MPAVSQAQHRMAVEDLRRLDAGEPTRTGMRREDLEELANTPNVHELPERAPQPPKKPAQRSVY